MPEASVIFSMFLASSKRFKESCLSEIFAYMLNKIPCRILIKCPCILVAVM